MSVEDNLLCVAILTWAVLYWIYYVKVVRHPKNSWRYEDSGWCMRHLHLYPYALLMLGSISAAALLAQLDIPQVVGYWFVKVPMFASIGLCFVGFLGMAGVPLPYPFLPKWAVKKQKEEWNRTIGYVKEFIQKLRDRLLSRRRK